MLLKNERCGKYELLEKLASGGMADIYLARTVSLDGSCKFIAIKRIQPQLSKDKDFVNMFREEAKIAISLNHNNIVSVLDFGYETDQYYLVMEYVDGFTLKKLYTEFKRENKTLSIEQILYLVKEAASGLDYAHHATNPTNGKPLNLIHRDISPQNIMIAYHGAVKVIDFGIAQVDAAHNNKKTGTLKGKFRYMSPEQAELLELDSRSDVFSLGVVLWELLANDHLFNDKNDIKILHKIKACQIPSIRHINPRVPAELEQIVNKALTKDRNLRYQTAAEMSRDLNRMLNQKYPEFSQQEFGLAVKTFFQNSYENHRQKLINYAQMPWEESKELIVFNPMEAQENISTKGSSEFRTPVAALSTDTAADLPEGFEFDKKSITVQKSKINFGQLLEENIVPESVKAQNLEKDMYALSKQNNMGIKSKKSTVTPVPATVESQGLIEKFAIYAIIALSLSIFYYSFSKYFFSGVRTRISRMTETQNIKTDAAPNTPTEQLSSSAQKEKIVPIDLDEKNKNIKIAYINIKLLEENPGIKIKVNGMQILDTPPIYMYPVAAGKETVITAYDPATQKQIEKKLIVDSEKSVDVILSLKSE